MGAAMRLFARALACAALIALAGPVSAHKASDSYLQVEESAAGLSLRWDIALRDLDAALDLDLDADGRLTWGEIKTGWPRIESYALAHLQIEGCAIRAGERSLERRNDGAYAVLHLAADCRLSGPPVIAYTLFGEVDPTHTGSRKSSYRVGRLRSWCSTRPIRRRYAAARTRKRRGMPLLRCRRPPGAERRKRTRTR